MPKKTFEVASETKSAAILQVKSNQKQLLKAVIDITEKEDPIETYDTWEVAWRNRIEQRVTEVFENKYEENDISVDWTDYIASIVRTTRIVKKLDTKNQERKKTIEIAYHISQKRLSAAVLAKYIRSHRRIEATHYVRDVSMKEDKSRIRTKPQYFAICRSFWLNAFRACNTNNIKWQMFKNNGNIELVFEMMNEF